MSVFIRNIRPNAVYNAQILWRFNSTTAETLKQSEEEEEFRVLDILQKKERQQRKVIRRTDIQPDRSEKMRTDQVNQFIFTENENNVAFIVKHLFIA